MQPVIFIESGADGVLLVNGFFCGPVGEGQSFPAGRDAEVFIQLFPFGEALPLTVQLRLRNGQVERLVPQEAAYALCWPDGVIEVELRSSAQQAQEDGWTQRQEESGVLMRYLTLRLLGDMQAERLLLDARQTADLSGYEAAVPLRFAPKGTAARYDERAGLVRRLEENVAAVDAALAATVPVGQGMRRIERIDIVRTGEM
ncbi:MAG: hypothetical protein IKV90_00680 [Clostridia bacterium]|nr:hypothetical protein [Clostridia bacterium]